MIVVQTFLKNKRVGNAKSAKIENLNIAKVLTGHRVDKIQIAVDLKSRTEVKEFQDLLKLLKFQFKPS